MAYVYDLVTASGYGGVDLLNPGDNVPVKLLTADLGYIQSGSGDPTPSNKRPIYGAISVSVYPDLSTPTVLSWESRTDIGPVAGGTIDVLTGKLTVNYAYVNLGTLTYTRYTGGTNPVFTSNDIDGMKTWANGNTVSVFKCSTYTPIPNARSRSWLASNLNDKGISILADYKRVTIRDDSYTNATNLKNSLNGEYIVVELDTPIVYELGSGLEVKTYSNNSFLNVVSNLNSSGGVVLGLVNLSYWSGTEVIDQYTINDTTLFDIADAIREKKETTAPILVKDFADEILSIESGMAIVERLVYVEYVGRDQQQIPVINTMDQGDHYSNYISYDETTRKFTCLQDFTALVIPWVMHYTSYGSSMGKGEFYVNNVLQGLRYHVPEPGTQGLKDGIRLWIDFHQGDTFWNYTPNSDGYPQQFLKMYYCKDVPITSDYFDYSDEEER